MAEIGQRAQWVARACVKAWQESVRGRACAGCTLKKGGAGDVAIATGATKTERESLQAPWQDGSRLNRGNVECY